MDRREHEHRSEGELRALREREGSSRLCELNVGERWRERRAESGARCRPEVALRPKAGEPRAEGWDIREIVHCNRRVGEITMEHERIQGLPPATRLHEIRIDEEAHRGRGLGSEALKEAEGEARRRGSRSVKGVLSTVDMPEGARDDPADRERLADFYRRNGYEVSVDREAGDMVYGTFEKRL